MLANDRGLRSPPVAYPHGQVGLLTQWQLISKRDHFKREHSKRESSNVQALMKLLLMSHWPKLVP